jgi:hypothetical protein
MEDVKTANSELVWYFYVTKRRRLRLAKFKDNRARRIALHNIKRKGKKEYTETVLAFFHRQRTRTLWMHPRTQIWFEMVDDIYNDELWYANFRVTKETFTFILRKVEPEIAHENTHLREEVSAKRRLAVTLYYLASTA